MTDILLPCDGGHTCIVYHVMPAAASRGLVIVAHEAYGLTPEVRDVCDRLAAAGYRAAAPDLFSRRLQGRFLPYGAEGDAQGLQIAADLTSQTLIGDIRAVLEGLDASAPRAVVGFGLGGTIAWLAAASLPLHAAIAYYPFGIETHLDVTPHCPILLQVGRSDAALPTSAVDAVAAAFPHTEIERYVASGAFDRDTSAPDAAAAAWERSLEFLDRRLAARR